MHLKEKLLAKKHFRLLDDRNRQNRYLRFFSRQCHGMSTLSWTALQWTTVKHRYNEVPRDWENVFVTPGFAVSGFFSIHFTVTGLKPNIVYLRWSVILGCVKRAVFHCNENFKFNKIFPFEAYLSASILTGIYKFTVKLFFLPFWALNVVNKASSLRVPQIIITAFTTSKYFCTSLRKPECVREIIDFVIYNNIIRTREHAFDLQRGLITLLLREKDRLIQLLCFVYVVVFCYSLPLHYTRYDAWFSVNVLT